MLPFDNLSDDKEQGYLADGITEDLTTELARIPGLFVISRNAAFTYKGKAVQPAQVAKELGVRYILEGSIRRAGDEHAHQRPADRHRHQRPSLGGALRRRLGRRFRAAGSGRGEGRRRASVAAGLRPAHGGGSRRHGRARRLRPLLRRLTGSITAEFLRKWLRSFDRQWRSTRISAKPGLNSAGYTGMAWASTRRKGRSAFRGHRCAGKIKEFLSEAEKHPSSNYYNLMADLLLWQRKSDEAIASAGRAIALDPSDRWAYNR